MAIKKSTFIAIGGGDFAASEEVVSEFVRLAQKASDPRVAVMTVATSEPEKAASKYSNIFRRRGINHVDIINVALREDAFDPAAVKKVQNADALFFTGGDQLNITTLLGGSDVYRAITDRVPEGLVIAGTSAGAAMMSKWMIISGDSDKPPSVGAVDIAPGMDLVDSMLIDTHFSQRGRHGRLLSAVAHFPEALGVGIDENTAFILSDGELRVVGEGVITIMDGTQMKKNDLPYKKEGEPLGISGVTVDVLPSGYRYRVNTRETISPSLKNLAHPG